MPSFPMAIPFSLVCLARSDGAATLAEVSVNVATSNGVLISSTTSPTIEIHGPSGIQTANANAGAGWDTDNIARALILTYDGTNGGGVLTANGIAVPLTFAGVASGTGAIPTIGFIGADHAVAAPLTGAMGFFGIVPGRIISAGEAASILAYLAQFWYLPPASSVTRNTIGVGDSEICGAFTVNTGESKQYGFYNRALDILGPRMGVAHNFGVSGVGLVSGTFNVLAQWTVNGPGALVPGMPNVVIVEGGLNDISALAPTTTTAATAAGFTTGGNMHTVVAQIASDMSSLAGGPHYIEVQSVITPASSGFEQMARRKANDFIRANYRSWGNSNVKVRLVDIALDAAISMPGTGIIVGPYYDTSNTEHPCKPGQDRWAALLARDILAAGL